MTSPESELPTPPQATGASPEPRRDRRGVAACARGRATTHGYENVNAFFNRHHALQDVNLTFPANTVTALIGPIRMR